MAITWDGIVYAANARRSENGALIDRMIQVRDRVNGGIVTPLPNVEGEPDVHAPMPSLVYDAIEHNAMRAASVWPVTWCPSTKEGQTLNDKRATTRRRALASTHDHSNAKNLSRRWYRQVFGYGTMAGVVCPDFTWRNMNDAAQPGRARLEMRDPLLTYPEQRTPDDMRPPLNAVFIYGRSPEWILRTYGSIDGVPELIRNGFFPWVQTWDVVEWVDEDVCVIGILGPRLEDAASIARAQQLGLNKELRRYPTRCNGLVPVVAPWRVTLDRLGGAVGHLLHISDWVARLTALEVTAAKKGVFPDMVIVTDDGEPGLVDSQWHAGSSGLPNLIRNAKSVALLNNQPNEMTRRLIDSLEASFDRSSGYLAQYEGRTTGALRTGRGISALTEVASDPRLMELQDIFTKALQHMNTCVLEMEKAMWPDRKFVVFTGWGADKGVTEYVPGKDFDTTLCGVGYLLPGMDISQISVVLPQRVGAELMSRKSAMEADPLIEDADAEMALIRQEQMERGLFQAMLAQTQTPGGPLNPEDWALIARKIGQGMELSKAFLEVNDLIKQRQAEMAAAQQQQAGAPTPPEAQPGVLAPGPSLGAVGAAPGPAPAPPPGEGFQQIMAALQRSPQRALPPGPPLPAGAR